MALGMYIIRREYNNYRGVQSIENERRLFLMIINTCSLIATVHKKFNTVSTMFL